MGRFSDDLDAERDLLVVLSNRAPKNWHEGVAHLLARRKELLMGEVDHASGARIMEISHQIDALGKICELIGALMPSKENISNVRRRKKGDTRREHALRLGRTMTPDGWRKKIEEPLERAQDKARDKMLKRDNIEANRAFIEESRRCLRFLDLVEKDFRRVLQEERVATLRKVS
tara:strand:- start:1323 stop:1844 length:522 start_codon:yes stop_codon:yes gene_type:complete